MKSNEIHFSKKKKKKGKTVVVSREFFEDLVFDKIDVPSQPVYHGDVNAFVLEIFTMRDEMKCRWSRNFVEAAFECYPEMDYCVILLPFSHPFLPLLKHFVVRCASFTIRDPRVFNFNYPSSLNLQFTLISISLISCL